MGFIDNAQTKNLLKKYDRPYLTIECGDWTYGLPKLRLATHDKARKLTIGRYCSIANDVDIYVGRDGRHPIDTISTYPIGIAIDPIVQSQGDIAKSFPDLYDPSRTVVHDDLDVEIGHDVWIGGHTKIMAGIKIGTGAVIGLGAIVTRDVPPYGVVVGAPARVSKFRHDDATIEKLIASQWWQLEPDEIWRRCGSLFGSRKIDAVLSLLATER